MEASASVGEEKRWGKTLKSACRIGHTGLIELLIKAGADVNIGDVTGTPLTTSALYGFTSCVEVLIEAGADVNIRNTAGHTALLEAAKNCHPKCLNLIIKAGADVNYTIFNDYSALSAAVGWCKVRKRWIQCAKLLLQAGAHVNKAVPMYCKQMLDSVFDLEGFMLLFAAGAPLDETTTVHGEYLVQEKQGMSLKNLCREEIRKHLMKLTPTSLFVRIPQLGLPSLLVSYLLYDVSLNFTFSEYEED